MLLVSLLMATAQRFLSGIHDRKECGLNKRGFAALRSVSQSVDLHNIDNYPCGASESSMSHSKKRAVSSQDTVAYLML